MRNKMRSLLVALLLLITIAPPAYAAISEADAKYAKAAGKATEDFSKAIGDWGNTYQIAPNKVNSAEYKSWMKDAINADKAVKETLNQFSKIKVSKGYKKSDVTLRKFIKAYSAAIDLYAPAIKKNDKKLVQKANDALVAATTLFTNWGYEFAKDSSALVQ